MQDTLTEGMNQAGFKEVKSKKKKRDPKTSPPGSASQTSPPKPPDETLASKSDLSSSSGQSGTDDRPPNQDDNVTTTRGSTGLFKHPFGSDQSFDTPTSQEVVSFRVDSQIKSARKSASEAKFAETTGIHMDDDPRAIIMDVIEEAYVNIGGREKLFHLTEHALAIKMFGDFGMTTWNSMFERLTSRHVLSAYGAAVDSFTTDLYAHKDSYHPIRAVISCFMFHAPLVIMRHVMAMINQETRLGLLEFRLFGSQEFENAWDRWLLRERFPMSKAECTKLYFPVSPLRTGNLIKHSFMSDLVDHWEDDDAVGSPTMPDPHDYAPEDYVFEDQPPTEQDPTSQTSTSTDAPPVGNSTDQQNDTGVQMEAICRCS
jgi:hypothetical protein